MMYLENLCHCFVTYNYTGCADHNQWVTSSSSFLTVRYCLQLLSHQKKGMDSKKNRGFVKRS